MKTAIVHYWLVSLRGGEKVVKSMLKLYPEADIYTLFADPELIRKEFPNNNVYTCAFNTPFFRKHYQKLFPLYPLFMMTLRLRQRYDLLISSESGPAKGIRKHQGTPHLCYVHTPMRYAWGFTQEYLRVLPRWARPVAAFFFKLLQIWDKTTVDNVDRWVANSRNVAQRVLTYYGKQAEVIYPPIEDDIYRSFEQAQALVAANGKTHFVCFGALVPYKRVDIAVECFNRNGLSLEVYGTGAELERLRAMAKPNVRVRGALPTAEFLRVLAQSRALIFPGEEDFGMIPVEVMALGTPVIALKKGGALETVLDSGNPATSTGLFFAEQTAESLQVALDQFLQVEKAYNPQFIHGHALHFAEATFLKKMQEQITALLQG